MVCGLQPRPCWPGGEVCALRGADMVIEAHLVWSGHASSEVCALQTG